jgi:hypothetical protein
MFIMCIQFNDTLLSHATYSNQSINPSINHSIMLRPRSPPPDSPTASTPLVALARAEKTKRDDLLSVRLAPHAIQPLITTRTSNCDYAFLLYTSSIPYTTLRQQPRPCATSLEQTRLTRLRRRQLSCNVVSRPSCANRESTPSTCMLRYLSSSTITQPDIICLVALSLADDKLFLLQCSPASAPLPKWPALHWHARRRPA